MVVVVVIIVVVIINYFMLLELLSHTHLQQLGNQRLLIKPCPPHHLLPNDFISSMLYMAPVRLSFSMTSSCFTLLEI